MRVESILILALFFSPLLASMVMISSSSKKGNGRSTSEAEVKGAFPFRLFYEQDQRDLTKWTDAAMPRYSMGHNFQLRSSFSNTVCVGAEMEKDFPWEKKIEEKKTEKKLSSNKEEENCGGKPIKYKPLLHKQTQTLSSTSMY